MSNNIIIGSSKLIELSTGLTERQIEGFIENESYFDFVEAVNYALYLL
ncbi:MAG: hypothetical protein R2728_07045 [Chitinophagales bacterium]